FGSDRSAKTGSLESHALNHKPERAPVLLWASVVGICVFVAAPMVIAVVVSFSSANHISFPPPGWSLKWYAAAFANRTLLEGVALSGGIALVATCISTVLGTSAA